MGSESDFLPPSLDNAIEFTLERLADAVNGCDAEQLSDDCRDADSMIREALGDFRAPYESMGARIAELEANNNVAALALADRAKENEELRSALRKHCIIGYECLECRREVQWRHGYEEGHAPTCLARPEETGT